MEVSEVFQTRNKEFGIRTGKVLMVAGTYDIQERYQLLSDGVAASVLEQARREGLVTTDPLGVFPLGTTFAFEDRFECLARQSVVHRELLPDRRRNKHKRSTPHCVPLDRRQISGIAENPVE